MIDPANITDFNRTKDELEEFAIFAVLVAGKTAKTIAPRLENILKGFDPKMSPFDIINFYGQHLQYQLKAHGIGCYSQKAQTLLDLVHLVRLSNVDLETCLPGELETVRGIGLKTSRFFIMHSRPNARAAALDTHILKGLKEMGVYNVPKATPSSPKEYRRLEQQFLEIADMVGESPADLDLNWWRHYSGNNPA